LNLCSVCGEDFGGLHAFDKHREFWHEHHRCPTVVELQELGFVRNGHGRWTLATCLIRARVARATYGTTAQRAA
jgi:hypothetical protein